MSLANLFDSAQLKNVDFGINVSPEGKYLYGDREGQSGPSDAEYVQGLRNLYKIPPQVGDAAVKQWGQTQLGPLIEANRKKSSGFDQFKEFAGVPLWMGSMAIGGPVAGAISAANGSGATQSLGIDPTITTLAALGYGAYNSPSTQATVPGTEQTPSDYSIAGPVQQSNADYWSKTYAANDTGTMTDASGVQPAGEKPMWDWLDGMDPSAGFDPGAEGMWTPSPPGVGDAGAFDQWGSATGATGPGTNPGDTIFGGSASNPYPGGDILQQAGEFAKKYGGSVLSALQILSRGVPGALGAVAANKQAGSLSALSDKYMAMGAPSRSRYEESFAPGFTMMNDPGYKDALDQTTKATLHGMSVNGNPAGSPNAWTQTLSDVNSKFAYPALQSYRTGNANAGGLATFNAAAPGAAGAAIDARGNVLNSAGAAVNDIFNPRQSLADLLRAARVG